MDFRPLPSPVKWHGRYSRIPGKATTFRVGSSRGTYQPSLHWYRDGYKLNCEMVASASASQLAHAIVRAKTWLGGAAGGAFQINEFGQVLVPSSAKGYEKAFVGYVGGPLEFKDPIANGTFILRRVVGIQPGMDWPLPYVGMPFNLSRASRIYFWHEDADGGRKVEPPLQDQDLVRRLRSIRRSGAVRFIVTLHGDVVTKRAPAGAWKEDETWEPVYVGRLNPHLWFTKEGAQ